MWCGVLVAHVDVGIDRLFQPEFRSLVENKKVGLITNHTGINARFESTLTIFERAHKDGILRLTAVFAPEHGLYAAEGAGRYVEDQKTQTGIPIYSLHGVTRRPAQNVLKKLDVLVYDIQDIGCRSYTYTTTLFYAMEEAAKANLPVVVLDRPNPLGGTYVDGPVLEDSYRSFVGYVRVPYCHGMTVGELARFFNGEYKVGCRLSVVPMNGWRRWMRFESTGLPWIPTSPNVPEVSTPWFYATTGLIGELACFCIGGGYFPFKILVTPWFDGKKMAKLLNRGIVEGVHFQPIRVKPRIGLYQGKLCDGVFLVVTDWTKYNPMQVLFALCDCIKQLYPEKLREAFSNMKKRISFFYSLVGTRAVHDILMNESEPFVSLCCLHRKEREAFLTCRRRYLLPCYSNFGTQ